MNQIARSTRTLFPSAILRGQATYHCSLIESVGRQGQVASLWIKATSCLSGATGSQLTHVCPKALAMGSDDQLKAPWLS